MITWPNRDYRRSLCTGFKIFIICRKQHTNKKTKTKDCTFELDNEMYCGFVLVVIADLYGDVVAVHVLAFRQTTV